MWTAGRCVKCGTLNPMFVRNVTDERGEGKCRCSKRHVAGCRAARGEGAPCRCRMLFAPHVRIMAVPR
jgi:hypothetical protein